MSHFDRDIVQSIVLGNLSGKAPGIGPPGWVGEGHIGQGRHRHFHRSWELEETAYHR